MRHKHILALLVGLTGLGTARVLTRSPSRAETSTSRSVFQNVDISEGFNASSALSRRSAYLENGGPLGALLCPDGTCIDGR